MKRVMMIITLSALSTLAVANTNLCKTFTPADNKQFADTYLLNFLTVSRSGNKINGQFTHHFGNNKVLSSAVSGICNSNQLSFSWKTGDFYGQFSGTLQCVNNVYNIVNVIAVVNGQSIYMNAMVSPPDGGTCP